MIANPGLSFSPRFNCLGFTYALLISSSAPLSSHQPLPHLLSASLNQIQSIPNAKPRERVPGGGGTAASAVESKTKMSYIVKAEATVEAEGRGGGCGGGGERGEWGCGASERVE
ncbi:hypothetical protein Droror1_Dr00011025 [Drosera rotundifolia]